jgi:hypothetical protein
MILINRLLFNVFTHHNTHLLRVLELPTIALFITYPLVSCAFHFSPFIVFIIYVLSSSSYCFTYFVLFSRLYNVLFFYHMCNYIFYLKVQCLIYYENVEGKNTESEKRRKKEMSKMQRYRY